MYFGRIFPSLSFPQDNLDRKSQYPKVRLTSLKVTLWGWGATALTARAQDGGDEAEVWQGHSAGQVQTARLTYLRVRWQNPESVLLCLFRCCCGGQCVYPLLRLSSVCLLVTLWCAHDGERCRDGETEGKQQGGKEEREPESCRGGRRRDGESERAVEGGGEMERAR